MLKYSETPSLIHSSSWPAWFSENPRGKRYSPFQSIVGQMSHLSRWPSLIVLEKFCTSDVWEEFLHQRIKVKQKQSKASK